MSSDQEVLPAYVPSDNEVKHLEFIQGVISRLANNSFLMKGWALTVSGAIFSFATSHLSWQIASLGLLPPALFWFLDSYFLWQERLFRKLYTGVASGKESIPVFSMDPSRYKGSHSWNSAFRSVTLVPFYGALIIVGVAIILASLAHHHSL